MIRMMMVMNTRVIVGMTTRITTVIVTPSCPMLMQMLLNVRTNVSCFQSLSRCTLQHYQMHASTL
eukprot:6200202-Pleurochrysis_carterae.AAC.1